MKKICSLTQYCKAITFQLKKKFKLKKIKYTLKICNNLKDYCL